MSNPQNRPETPEMYGSDLDLLNLLSTSFSQVRDGAISGSLCRGKATRLPRSYCSQKVR